jgi:hypothetical protein
METTGRRRAWVVCTVTLLLAAAFLGLFASGSQGAKAASATHKVPASVGATTTSATPSVPTTTLPAVPATTPPVPTTTVPPAAPAAPAETAATPDAEPSGYGCAAALAYLASNANPEFSFQCPGYADGHEAMTCINNASCPGEHLIAIADPCPAAYMNEAYNSNSWSDSLGEFTRPIDPYGAC